MTTPALQRLREAQPAAQITLLTPAKLADIWANHPAINAIETFQPEESAFGIGRRLREGNFDIALVLPNSPRSALETWLARIPERVGYARPWRNWLLSQAIVAGSGEVKTRKRSIGEIKRLIRPDSRGPADRPAATAHQMHHYLRLSAALGANIVPLPPKLTVASEAEAR